MPKTRKRSIAAINSPPLADIGDDANGRFLNSQLTSFSRNFVQVSKDAGDIRLLFTRIRFPFNFFDFL